MSIGVLVDSCIIIDHLRSRDKFITRYTGLLKRFDRFFISVATEEEIEMQDEFSNRFRTVNGEAYSLPPRRGNA